MRNVEHFVRQTLTELNRLHRAYLLANSATTVREAQTAYQQFWADPERFQLVKEIHETGAVTDPQMARQIRLIYLSAMEYGAQT